MKRLLLALIMLMTAATAAVAQKEHDFATHFTATAAREDRLTCRTVSPQMMERIMQFKEDETDNDLRRVLAQIKSIRIVTADDEDARKGLYARAGRLAGKNARRYRPYAQTDDTTVYARRRGKYIVEIVVMSFKDNRHFSLIDMTGNMTEDFISQLMKL